MSLVRCGPMLSPSSRWRERSAHSTCRLSSISRIWPDKVIPSAWASAARAFLREVDPFAVEIGQLERELMTRTGKPPQACVSSIAVRTKRAIVAAGGISDTMRVPLSERSFRHARCGMNRKDKDGRAPITSGPGRCSGCTLGNRDGWGAHRPARAPARTAPRSTLIETLRRRSSRTDESVSSRRPTAPQSRTAPR
jgi:hypothetical protein